MERYSKALFRWKRSFIIRALQDNDGCQIKAARAIGVHRNTIHRLLREAGITHRGVKTYLATQRKDKSCR